MKRWYRSKVFKNSDAEALVSYELGSIVLGASLFASPYVRSMPKPRLRDWRKLGGVDVQLDLFVVQIELRWTRAHSKFPGVYEGDDDTEGGRHRA